MATRDLRMYFSLKQNKTIKKLKTLKINLTSDLVKSSEDVTLADAEAVGKELKSVTSNNKRGKYELNISSRMRAEVEKYAKSARIRKPFNVLDSS